MTAGIAVLALLRKRRQARVREAEAVQAEKLEA
jgi:hypothetical protein